MVTFISCDFLVTVYFETPRIIFIRLSWKMCKNFRRWVFTHRVTNVSICRNHMVHRLIKMTVIFFPLNFIHNNSFQRLEKQEHNWKNRLDMLIFKKFSNVSRQLYHFRRFRFERLKELNGLCRNLIMHLIISH